MHSSPQIVLATPPPLTGETGVVARAELIQLDETGERPDSAALFVQGDSAYEFRGLEADIFIAQAQAWVDGLRALRRQMREG